MTDDVYEYIKELETVIRDLEAQIEETRDEFHAAQDDLLLVRNALRDAQRLNAILEDKLSHYYV
jgi:chromosome segregation ATPase